MDAGQQAPVNADRQWYIVGRWQEYEGESRANLLRIAGIGAFYLVELANYYGLPLPWFEMPPIVDRPFHQAVTGLAMVWTMAALAILICLQHRVFPALLKYVSTACDLALLTAILMVADGPRSPLVIGYFLVIALAAIRFSLPLMRFATAGSIAGYLFLLGFARWGTTRDLRVPRYEQVIFLIGLLLTGIMLGQVLRRLREVADEYAARVRSSKEETP